MPGLDRLFLIEEFYYMEKIHKKKDNIKKKYNKTANYLTYVHKYKQKLKVHNTVGGLGLALEIQTVKAELLIY